jgi:hypothetical protein
MITSAYFSNKSLSFLLNPTLSSSEETKASRLFTQTCPHLAQPQDVATTLHPLLLDPIEMMMGAMWAFFGAIGAVCSIDSVNKLYQNCRVEQANTDRFRNIAIAFNRAMVDLVELGGTCAYTVHWLSEVKLISVTVGASFLRGVGGGCTLVANTLRSGAALYDIYCVKEAILAERRPAEREKHKQRLCLALMKLIGYVSMAAWAALGLSAAVLGATLSPLLISATLTTLLGVSCVFSGAALFYQWKLEGWPEWFPYPQAQRRG